MLGYSVFRVWFLIELSLKLMIMNRRDLLKTSGMFLGYAVSASALSGLYIGCKNGAVARKGLDWKPVFLNPEQADMISEMTERILPRTKTPGAKDLHIDVFIDKMLKDLLTPVEQQDFVGGLDSFESACKGSYGKKFVDCKQEEQEAFLRKMDKESKKLPPSVWGISLAAPSPTPFYRRVKELTLLGYFTSQEIGQKVLSYDPLPGVYIGDYPVAKVGNAWNE